MMSLRDMTPVSANSASDRMEGQVVSTREMSSTVAMKTPTTRMPTWVSGSMGGRTKKAMTMPAASSIRMTSLALRGGNPVVAVGAGAVAGDARFMDGSPR